MSKRVYRKRPIRVEVCLSQAEYEEVKTNAKKSGLNLSEYTRRLYKSETIVSAPTTDVLILIREIKRVGSNLNQLLRKLNSLGVVASLELEACIDDTHKTVDSIYRTYRPGTGGG